MKTTLKFSWFVLAMLVVIQAAEAQVLRVTAATVNLRTQPTTASGVVTAVTKGTMLEVVETYGSWYMVDVLSSGDVGYIHRALVEVVEGQAATTAQRPAGRAAPPPAAPSPPPPSRRVTAAPPPQLPPAQPSVDFEDDDAPWDHRGFGLGVRTGWSTLGSTAFNLRSLGDTAGFTFDLSYVGGNPGAGNISSLQLSPGLLFNIGQPADFEAVYLQPYVGGGGNLVWSRVSDNFIDADHYKGVSIGWSAFGGVDLGFHAVPSLTISADFVYLSDDVYNTCPVGCALDANVSGLGLTIGANWYFK